MPVPREIRALRALVASGYNGISFIFFYFLFFRVFFWGGARNLANSFQEVGFQRIEFSTNFKVK